MIILRKRKGKKKPARGIALVLAFYFLFYGIDLSFLLEITPVDAGGLKKAIELISQMDEILPSEDNAGEKRKSPIHTKGTRGMYFRAKRLIQRR